MPSSRLGRGIGPTPILVLSASQSRRFQHFNPELRYSILQDLAEYYYAPSASPLDPRRTSALESRLLGFSLLDH